MYFLLIPLSLFGTSFSASAAVTLKDAFQAARLNMETLKRAEATIEQREEQKNRARAAILPNISGVGNYTRIDPPTTGNVSSAFTLKRQYSVGVRLTQPLIRGGVIGAYDLAKENVLLAEFQKDASDITLYQLVINSFYNLKISQMDLKNLEILKKSSSDRVREIRERTQIGRSRKGELVEAEAQLAAAESQYQQGIISLEAAVKNFEYYTRLNPGEIPDLDAVPRLTSSINEYIGRVKSRPDIMASQQQVKVAENQIRIAKGGHYPSVDLVGNYYFDRTGILQTSEWDAAVVFTVPFYQGGSVMAATREAAAGKRIAELTASETLRTAERDLTILYQNLAQLQLQLDALKHATAKAEEAYRLNRKDYTFGLVTNLDVLQSLNAYITIKRSYDTVYAMAHMTYKNFEASIGVLP